MVNGDAPVSFTTVLTNNGGRLQGFDDEGSHLENEPAGFGHADTKLR